MSDDLIPPCPLCQSTQTRVLSSMLERSRITIRYLCDRCGSIWDITGEKETDSLKA